MQWCHYVLSEGTYTWDFSVATSFNTHSSNVNVMGTAKSNIKQLIETIDKPLNTTLNNFDISEKIVVETKYNLRKRKNNEIEVNGYKLKTNNKCKCNKCTTEDKCK